VIPTFFPERAYAVSVGTGETEGDGKAELRGDLPGLLFRVHATRDDGRTQVVEIRAQFFIAG